MKTLTPIKSIRKYCLWCCQGSKMEIKLCTVFDCPLYQYRIGRKIKKSEFRILNPKMTDEDFKRIVFLTPVKAMKSRCEYCSNFKKKGIRNCEFKDCSLYSYRLGKNPSRSGIGGNLNLNVKNNNSDNDRNNDGKDMILDNKRDKVERKSFAELENLKNEVKFESKTSDGTE